MEALIGARSYLSNIITSSINWSILTGEKEAWCCYLKWWYRSQVLSTCSNMYAHMYKHIHNYSISELLIANAIVHLEKCNYQMSPPPPLSPQPILSSTAVLLPEFGDLLMILDMLRRGGENIYLYYFIYKQASTLFGVAPFLRPAA